MEKERDSLDDLGKRYEEIFDLMQRVDGAVAGQRDAELAACFIEDFARCAEKQLAKEEEFLKSHHNPEFRAHLAQHRFFAREMSVLKSAFRTGQLALASNIVAFLKAWFTWHLAKACRKYEGASPEMEY